MLRRGLAENIQQLLSCGHILTLISLSPSSSPCFMSLAWPDGMSLLKIDPLYKVELCDSGSIPNTILTLSLRSNCVAPPGIHCAIQQSCIHLYAIPVSHVSSSQPQTQPSYYSTAYSWNNCPTFVPPHVFSLYFYPQSFSYFSTKVLCGHGYSTCGE